MLSFLIKVDAAALVIFSKGIKTQVLILLRCYYVNAKCFRFVWIEMTKAELIISPIIQK